MKHNPEEDWKLERQLALRKEGWTDTGPKRVVKVVKPGTVLTEARGFILIGLSIVGQTPHRHRIRRRVAHKRLC